MTTIAPLNQAEFNRARSMWLKALEELDGRYEFACEIAINDRGATCQRIERQRGHVNDIYDLAIAGHLIYLERHQMIKCRGLPNFGDETLHRVGQRYPETRLAIEGLGKRFTYQEGGDHE